MLGNFLSLPNHSFSRQHLTWLSWEPAAFLNVSRGPGKEKKSQNLGFVIGKAHRGKKVEEMRVFKSFIDESSSGTLQLSTRKKVTKM